MNKLSISVDVSAVSYGPKKDISLSMLLLASKAGSRKGVDKGELNMSSLILGLRNKDDPSEAERSGLDVTEPSPLRVRVRAGDTPCFLLGF